MACGDGRLIPSGFSAPHMPCCDHCITSGVTGAQEEPGGQGGHSSFLSDTHTDLANAELIARLAFS